MNRELVVLLALGPEGSVGSHVLMSRGEAGISADHPGYRTDRHGMLTPDRDEFMLPQTK